MKKLSKNFRQFTTVEAMANVCLKNCTCACATPTYCQCNTVSDYAGYQYYPARESYTQSNTNYMAQFDGIV